jgi:uncharacterized protein
MPYLARIAVYPIKSLDSLPLSTAQLLPDGGLQHDRQFAIRDANGKFVNAKRTAAIHGIESCYDPATRSVELGLRTTAGRQSFCIDADRQALENWLSRHFEMPVTLHEDAQQGFPDDLEASGPTLISRATLEAVANWFPGLSLDEVRLRFRANLEIDGVEPFWEDRLYTTAGSTVQFRIGGGVLSGTNPCQRCVVPTRSPSTGDIIAGFAKIFSERRETTLPAWAERSRFNHFYRLSVNTRTLTAGLLSVGDELTIVGPGE